MGNKQKKEEYIIKMLKKVEVILLTILRKLRFATSFLSINPSNLLFRSYELQTRVRWVYYPLDELPLIDQSRWVENPLVKKVIQVNGQNIKLTEISLYETAGCPFQCTYCATPALVDRNNGYKIYYRPSMDRILASTKLAIELGANAIHFIDDMAFVNPGHFREFADGVEKLKLPNQLYWRGMTRAPVISNQCSDEDLAILVQSGCWRI